MMTTCIEQGRGQIGVAILLHIVISVLVEVSVMFLLKIVVPVMVAVEHVSRATNNIEGFIAD